uniref:Secreted protein n=1 Tax=Ixodes ricinus TaxID=34613 RepID=A0A6B0UQ70_IXORI
MTSFQRAKPVPLSARTMCTILLVLARVSPLSRMRTGTPVLASSQRPGVPSWQTSVKYRLARQWQAYTYVLWLLKHDSTWSTSSSPRRPFSSGSLLRVPTVSYLVVIFSMPIFCGAFFTMSEEQ